ncbi:MAG TPA: hypothetical protein HA223_00475 [Nanoarchaeota archaeon]|nr:hypothetical protein [Nanoarchaeota archaeon]HIH33729.1 hypothetical protein [Nanoarchaeota archaeon]
MTNDKPLDTSQILRSERVKTIVREVALMEPSYKANTLEEVIFKAKEMGYKIVENSIVNVVHGSPKENEPRGALVLEKEEGGARVRDCLGDGLIIQDLDRQYELYGLYFLHDDFRYVK